MRNKRYNAYSVVATHGKGPRVDFAFARQPWAIKGTTLTALHRCNIHPGQCVHGNIDITFTTIYNYNIHNCGCIHCNIDITPTALRAVTIFIGIKFLLHDNSK